MVFLKTASQKKPGLHVPGSNHIKTYGNMINLPATSTAFRLESGGQLYSLGSQTRAAAVLTGPILAVLTVLADSCDINVPGDLGVKGLGF